MIENLGSIFMYLVGILSLVAFLFLIRFMMNRHLFLKKIYTYLAKMIFWNTILRMFLEGYMVFGITSLINIYNL